MKENYITHLKILSGIFILIIFYHFYLYSLTDHFGAPNDYYGPISAIIYLYGAVYGLIHLKKYKLGGRIAKAISLYSLGAIAYSTALFIWGYLVFVLPEDMELPYPSSADYFYLLFFPLCALGLMTTLKIYNLQITKKMTFTLIAGLLVAIAITGKYIGLPAFDFTESLNAGIINDAYIFADIILLWLAITTFIVAGGKITKGLFFVALSFLTQFIGDIFYTNQIVEETFWDGNYTDFIFTLSGLFISLAIVYTIKEFRPMKESV